MISTIDNIFGFVLSGTTLYVMVECFARIV